MAEPVAETMPIKYREFFYETPAGELFMKALDQMIAAEHERAESNPELARDHTQRARGIRDVIGKINGLTMEVNRGRM